MNDVVDLRSAAQRGVAHQSRRNGDDVKLNLKNTKKEKKKKTNRLVGIEKLTRMTVMINVRVMMSPHSFRSHFVHSYRI